MNNIPRSTRWNDLKQDWDLIIIGGGITGAGIFNMAVRKGYKALLVEAKDFAFGTSSRSSKLVHGGFRYLANRQYKVTAESVRERERLVREARHLVIPERFMLPSFKGDHVSPQKVRGGRDALRPAGTQVGPPVPQLQMRSCSTAPCAPHRRWSAPGSTATPRWMMPAWYCASSRKPAALGGTALNYAKVIKLARKSARPGLRRGPAGHFRRESARTGSPGQGGHQRHRSVER